jgi:uncharacterized protein (DUF2461 family)
VEAESPIHRTELTRRITEGSGLKRSGKRIQTAVQSTLDYGVRESQIQLKDDFIWNPKMEVPEVRNRSELEAASKKFEFVSPEEISAAILQEVERGFSLSEDEAVSNAARVLGFQRVTAKAKAHFIKQLIQLVDDGRLISREGVVSMA